MTLEIQLFDICLQIEIIKRRSVMGKICHDRSWEVPYAHFCQVYWRGYLIDVKFKHCVWTQLRHSFPWFRKTYSYRVSNAYRDESSIPFWQVPGNSTICLTTMPFPLIGTTGRWGIFYNILSLTRTATRTQVVLIDKFIYELQYPSFEIYT